MIKEIGLSTGDEEKYFLEKTLEFSSVFNDLANVLLLKLPREMNLNTARMILINAYAIAFSGLLGSYCHPAVGGDLKELSEKIYYDHQRLTEELLAKHSKRTAFSIKLKTQEEGG
jgi:hypothetical protein